MTTAKKFYKTFMKIGRALQKAHTPKQVSKAINSDLQPLAECFDDDGLDALDNAGLFDGYMFDDPERPILKSKSNKIMHGYTYFRRVKKVPTKTYIGNSVIGKQEVGTKMMFFDVVRYTKRSQVVNTLLVLLDMAMVNTDNRDKPEDVGGFWIDRSGITPMEHYHMLKVLGLSARKPNKTDEYKSNIKLASKKQELREKIGRSTAKINKYRKLYNEL